VHRNPQEFIGVDLGAKRVGIARGSSLARIAEPLKTVPAAGALQELAAIVKRYAASGVVVGLPRNLEGKDTGQTQAVRQWVDEAKKDISLPFFWQDEALTSVAADGDDAVAASVILQDFLDTPEAQRVRC
jgi:putative Holliday junction resolvase